MHLEQSVRREKTNKMQHSDVYYQLLPQHVSGIIMSIFRRTKHCSHPTTQRPTATTNHIQQNQRSTPYAVTHGLCSPEDGHNDARNMLRQKLIINIWLLHLVGFSLSSHFPISSSWRNRDISTINYLVTCTSIGVYSQITKQILKKQNDKYRIYLETVPYQKP